MNRALVDPNSIGKGSSNFTNFTTTSSVVLVVFGICFLVSLFCFDFSISCDSFFIFFGEIDEVPALADVPQNSSINFRFLGELVVVSTLLDDTELSSVQGSLYSFKRRLTSVFSFVVLNKIFKSATLVAVSHVLSSRIFVTLGNLERVTITR